MSSSGPFLWIRSHGIQKYAIAVLSVSAALLLTRWPPLHLEASPAALFFCAVMLTAWFGGFKAGSLAAVLATFAFDYYFLPPVHSVLAAPEEIPRLIVFAGSAFIIGGLSAAQRSATESLRVARNDLLGTVRELQRTNEALRAESVERRHAEDKLRRSEAYLAEAQRLSHTGSWAWNAATEEIVHESEEHQRLFGFAFEREALSLESVWRRIHMEDRDRIRETWDRAARARTDYAQDYRLVLPDRSVKYIHSEGHPVFNETGDLVEFIGTSIDVTERKRAEEERERLRQAQTDLAHVTRLTTMGELSASLAHEIKQPIAAAITDANTCVRWLARDEPDLEEARAAAMRVVKDATRASEIVNHVRMLFQKSASDRQLVDLNQIIREMIVLLQNETTRYSIAVRMELATDLPPVMGDHVQLQQVMMNLILNSIEAMREIDGIRELAIQSKKAEHGHLMVSVSDTGTGLPPQQTEKIFNAFFTTKVQGTGMGLSISRSIIESHEGRLWAGANSPRGACFFVSLPIQVEAGG